MGVNLALPGSVRSGYRPDARNPDCPLTMSGALDVYAVVFAVLRHTVLDGQGDLWADRAPKLRTDRFRGISKYTKNGRISHGVRRFAPDLITAADVV